MNSSGGLSKVQVLNIRIDHRRAHRRFSVPIEYTFSYKRERVNESLVGVHNFKHAPFRSWMVELAGSIPASVPRYRTSECESKEIDLLQRKGRTR